MSSSYRVYVPPDLQRFECSFSLLSTIIRAQYLFRSSRKAYQLKLKGKRNKQKRATERDWQLKLHTRLEERGIVVEKFSSAELESRANALRNELQTKHEVKEVIQERGKNIQLQNLHAEVTTTYTEKLQAIRKAQMAKCQEQMMAKLASKSTNPQLLEVASIIKSRSSDAQLSTLHKEVRAKGEEIMTRAEVRDQMRRRKSSIIVAELNEQIKQPNLQRLRSVVENTKSLQEEEMMRKLKRGSQRSTAPKPSDWNGGDEVRME